LIESIQRFDPSLSIPFKAFAIKRITGSLLDAGREACGRASRREPRPSKGSGPGEPFEPREGVPGPADVDWKGRVFSREPGPLSALLAGEVTSQVLDAMPDERLREIAWRRLILEESVDEVAMALGLGKTQVSYLLTRRVLPPARARMRKMGLGPGQGQQGSTG
jgi:hypothetical protein